MLSVSKEDLLALKKKKIKLIFILGPPGSGKGTQCEKLVNEFKYTFFSCGDLIRDHIKKKTDLGLKCIKFESQGQLVPLELIVAILVRSIVSSTGKNYLIHGFPRTMEQALYFEKNICEISIILNVQASDEICFERILQRGRNDKELARTDDKNESIIRNRLIEFHNQSYPVIEFYQKYGLVKNINSQMPFNSVYEQVVENLYPAIYSIIGKKYSGKTRISKDLANKMGFKIIDFKEFLNSDIIIKNQNDDTFVIKSLINKLRNEETSKILIEDFPLKKEHYSLFVKNCRKFMKIFYLNMNDDFATERMNRLPFSDSNYIGCSQLNTELYNFNLKNDFIKYLSEKSNLVEVNVNNHYEIVIDDLISKIKPSILLFTSDDGSREIQKELIKFFESKLNYEIIDVKQVIKDNCNRWTTIGRELTSDSGNFNLIIETLKYVIFKESIHRKYILVNYDYSIDEIKLLEKNICPIERLIFISNQKILPIKENSIELFFKINQRFSLYNKSGIDEYFIDDILGKNRNFDLIYGRPGEGKTCIINHLASKYSYKIIDFVDLIKSLKTAKGNLQDPPQDWESTELNFSELIQGFKELIDTLPFSRKFCLENILQNELVVDIYQVKSILQITGRPRKFYQVVCEESVLLDRYKTKKGIEEDLNEDQKSEMLESMNKPRELIEYFNSIAYTNIKVNTNLSEYKTQLTFDALFGRNIIVIKHDFNLNLDKSINLFSGCYQTLYINVPGLIYKHFYLNNEWARQLETSYNRIQLKFPEIFSTEEEKIYYKYNPIHFDSKLVTQLILDFIANNSKEIEDNGNFVILSGILNSDLIFGDDEICFNLPLHDVSKLLSFGQLTAFIQFTHQREIAIEETEEPEQIIIEQPKQKQLDVLDVDGDPVDQQQEAQPVDEVVADNDEEKPKFKPENYKWTNYDGMPRNYIQILRRLKKFPLEENSLEKKYANTALYSVLEKHLINYNDYNYNGVVNLTKII